MLQKVEARNRQTIHPLRCRHASLRCWWPGMAMSRRLVGTVCFFQSFIVSQTDLMFKCRSIWFNIFQPIESTFNPLMTWIFSRQVAALLLCRLSEYSHQTSLAAIRSGEPQRWEAGSLHTARTLWSSLAALTKINKVTHSARSWCLNLGSQWAAPCVNQQNESFKSVHLSSALFSMAP